MIPDVVAKACAELGAAADVFAFYSALCRAPAYKAVEAVEALLEGADVSSFFKTVEWDAFPVLRPSEGSLTSSPAGVGLWRRPSSPPFF